MYLLLSDCSLVTYFSTIQLCIIPFISKCLLISLENEVLVSHVGSLCCSGDNEDSAQFRLGKNHNKRPLY